MNNYYLKKLSLLKKYKKAKKSFFILFFKPSAYKSSISEINVNNLKNENIKLIICDLDQTLSVGYTKQIHPYTLKFIEELKKANIKLILLSNNKTTRVKHFAEMLEVEYVAKAFKPFTFKFKKLLANNKQYTLDEILIVGNQIITDIFLANIVGIRSILVSPLNSKEKKFISIIYQILEKLIYKKLQQYNLFTIE